MGREAESVGCAPLVHGPQATGPGVVHGQAGRLGGQGHPRTGGPRHQVADRAPQRDRPERAGHDADPATGEFGGHAQHLGHGVDVAGQQVSGRGSTAGERANADGRHVAHVDEAEPDGPGHGRGAHPDPVAHGGHRVAQLGAGVQRPEDPARADHDHRMAGLLEAHRSSVGGDLGSCVGAGFRPDGAGWVDLGEGGGVHPHGREVDDPFQAPVGGLGQDHRGRRRVHVPHGLGLTGIEAEHGAGVDEAVDPVHRVPEPVVVGQVGFEDLGGVGRQAVEGQGRSGLVRAADHHADVVSGGQRGGRAV